MAATGTARTRKRPATQADIIHTMLVQAVNAAQDKVQLSIKDGADGIDTAKARGERDALIAFKNRVRRYLDGDLTALYS